jgi:hypothetical protein
MMRRTRHVRWSLSLDAATPMLGTQLAPLRLQLFAQLVHHRLSRGFLRRLRQRRQRRQRPPRPRRRQLLEPGWSGDGGGSGMPNLCVAPRSPAYGTRDDLEERTLYAKTGATDISIPLCAPSFTDLEHMDYFLFLPLTTDMECLTHLGREHVSRLRRTYDVLLCCSVHTYIKCMDR